MASNRSNGARAGHASRSAKMKAERQIKRNRLEPGTWMVTNGLGECIAQGFDTDAEAQQWVDSR